MTNLDAALLYASWGWRVLPVVENGKEATLKDWPSKATTDPTIIKEWWGRNPNNNVAILAGAKSGLVVFDVDPRNGGEESWAAWLAAHGAGESGECATQLTQGGGFHYLAKYDESVPSCKLAPGIDLLSDGRYFLVYPSKVGEKSYQWEGSSDPADGVAPMVIPSEWIAAINSRRKTAAPRTGGASDGGGHTIMTGGRNSGLTALAGAMRNYGMTESEMLAALLVANDSRCDVPLPDSDVRRIAHSVARYSPDSDVAANAALGTVGVGALLRGRVTGESSDYFLTQATSFLSQPAPIPWLIKNWLPAFSTTMIFGASGIGKTFVALDMACHMASGLEWRGNKTREGVVVYLAGEGNYGIRTRLASWCKHHNVESLDNLYVSNRPIDMDSPGVGYEILRAIHEVTGGCAVVAVMVDTLNRHMGGDENSARDVRALLNSCSFVSSATGASIVLIHHTGHSEAANGRERGSSAIRASLDASILVRRAAGTDDVINILCAKMKDGPEPSPVFGELLPVDLGWIDEDGEAIEGCVLAVRDAPAGGVAKEDSKHGKHLQTFRGAWEASGAEERGGKPYISKDGLKDYMMKKLKLEKSSVGTYLKPSGDYGSFLKDLLNGGVISKYELGWVVEDSVLSFAWMVIKRN